MQDEIKSSFSEARGDNEALKAWFKKYENLKINDLCVILKITPNGLYKIRKKLGITVPKNTYRAPKRKLEPLDELPNDFKTKEWLSGAIKRYGASRIAELAGVNRSTIYHWAELGTNSELKPYMIKDNLVKLIHEERYTVEEVSNIFNVSHAVISYWLTKHGIEPVVMRMPVPLYVRLLKAKLEQLDFVRRVRIRTGHLRVSFYSNTVERYHFYTNVAREDKVLLLREADVHFKKIKEVEYEYCNYSNECDYPAHIKMNRDFRGFTYLERKLSIQRFLSAIAQNRWSGLHHPPDVLHADLERCKANNPDAYFHNGRLYPAKYRYGKPPDGYYLAEHFFRFPCGRRILCKKYSHARYVSFFRFYTKKKTVELSFRNFIKFICEDPLTKKNYGRRYRFYRDFGPLFALIKRLGITGSVLDLSPSYGYNALASAVCGLKYYHTDNNYFSKVLNNGFADFIGLEHCLYNGEEVDLVLYHDHYFPDFDIIKKYHDKGKRIIVYVPNRMRAEVVDKYSPQAMIEYMLFERTGKADYFAIW